MRTAFAHRSEEELFEEILRRRSSRADFRDPLGALVERWRDPARTVVRRVQGSYMRGSPEEADDVFQEAVGKLMARGLDQFRGVSEFAPGRAAAPRTFFLRIVKHVAIDRYRRQREAPHSPADFRDDDAAHESPHQIAQAVETAHGVSARQEATEEYWSAFERLRREHPNEASAWDLYHHQDVEDHGECARLLGISVANSYKRVSRAQAWLKLYLLELRSEEARS